MEILRHIFFWFFAILTVGSAVVVVFHPRVIYSAFALLFAFVGVAGLYVFLSADFLAAAQILIYVGGILTLIIFGVFLTARITTLDIPHQTHQRYLALVPMAMIGAGLYVIVLRTAWPNAHFLPQPTTQAIGELLLTKYLVPFELASILLLAALIGAMRLARYYRKRED